MDGCSGHATSHPLCYGTKALDTVFEVRRVYCALATLVYSVESTLTIRHYCSLFSLDPTVVYGVDSALQTLVYYSVDSRITLPVSSALLLPVTNAVAGKAPSQVVSDFTMTP